MKRLLYNPVRLIASNRVYQFTRIVLIILFVAACSSGDGDPDPDPDPELVTLTFAEVIASGEDYEAESYPATRTEEVLSESPPTSEDYIVAGTTETERSVCVTKTVSVLDGNGEFPLFDPNADVIYPGNLLQGKTLSDATPKPIVVERAGGTISYNLNNGNLNSTFSVDEVTKSSIQDGMNNIISGAGEVVPANFQVDIIQIESESQLALEMGIEVETFTTKVKADMSFSTEKKFNRTLVKVNQAYYTMSFDLPTSLDKIFGANVTPEQLKTYVQSDNPATFISSVTYGRIFYMLIESTSSRQEMEANLNITYDALAASGKGNLNVTAFNSLKETKIKVIAYGGDATGAFQLAGETDIATIAEKIGESTDIKAGLPLSYVVRSVERPDQIVGTKLSTEYDVVTCEVKGILPPTNYLPLVDLFEDGIGAAVQIAGTKIVVYNKAGNKYAYYDIAKKNDPPAVWNIDETHWGPMSAGGLGFGPVGAAVKMTEDLIFLFSMDGSEFVRLNYDQTAPDPRIDQYGNPLGSFDVESSGVLKTTPTSTYYSTSLNPLSPFPHAGHGIDAAIQLQYTRAVSVSQYLFANDGTDVAELEYYGILNRWGWHEKASTKSIFGEGLSFDKVGAATKVEFGTNTFNYLFFNDDGDQLIIQDAADNWSGPYVVN